MNAVATRSRDDGFVYVIRQSHPGATPAYKVGWATDPWARRDQFQTGNAHALDLIAVTRAPIQVETALHRYLKMTRLNGEWFDESRMLDVVCDLMRGDRDGMPFLSLIAPAKYWRADDYIVQARLLEAAAAHYRSLADDFSPVSAVMDAFFGDAALIETTECLA